MAPGFVALCRQVVLHRDVGRFGLLYRLLWRQHREPGLHADPLDPDMIAARRLARVVHRDLHAMRAFVRFRPLHEPQTDTPVHVAWFEPQHHVVEANAAFFVGRFTGMRWAILTPDRCLRWDGTALTVGRGAERADAPPADAGEALWLTYYRHIFNPARLKLRTMEQEMPRRYWLNLPEAALIGPLARDAPWRSQSMVERAPTLPLRRIVPIRPASTPRAAAPATTPRAATRDTTPAGAAAIPPRAGRRAPAVIGLPAGGRRTVTAAATAWTELRERAAGCTDCPLYAGATQTVFGEGPIGARMMLVGETPGDREDLEGHPFVGPAGRLLARAMAELGWERSAVYLTNAVKHFKYQLRGKRRMHKTPAQREADACLQWLEGEIALVDPQVIVALGATASRQLLGRPVPVLRERGQWLSRGDGRRVLVTLHPSALLRGDRAEMESAFAAWLDDLRKAGGSAGGDT